MKGSKVLVVILLAVSMALMGCATQNTVDMVGDYTEAYSKHRVESTKAVTSKAKAISEMMKFECEEDTEACGVAKALSNVIASQEIARIQPDPFEMKMPKTELDVQSQVLTTIGNGIPFITMGVVSYKSIAEDRGETTNTAGGDISTNYDEDHATAIGDKSSSSNSPTNSELVMPTEELDGAEGGTEDK